MHARFAAKTESPYPHNQSATHTVHVRPYLKPTPHQKVHCVYLQADVGNKSGTATRARTPPACHTLVLLKSIQKHDPKNN